jgi:fatty-acid peroxygenase
LKVALRSLTTIDYDVPEQDLRVRLSRLPAQPTSRLTISNVKRSSQLA